MTRSKREQSIAEAKTVYRMVNRDRSKVGVISTAENCGYDAQTLASLAKKGYRVVKEER